MKFQEIVEACNKANCKCGPDGCDDPKCKCKKKKVCEAAPKVKYNDGAPYWDLDDDEVDPEKAADKKKKKKDAKCKCEAKGPDYDDEAGDAKYHAKKDDELGEKCPKCKSTKGYVNGKCIGCGNPAKSCKESKFEQYMEHRMLVEEVDVVLEKLGSLDAMDAAELSLPANVALTVDILAKAFAKSGLTVDQFMSKLKGLLRGVDPRELENIKLVISGKTGSGGDQFGRSERAADSR
jgi:hypothetical protein